MHTLKNFHMLGLMTEGLTYDKMRPKLILNSVLNEKKPKLSDLSIINRNTAYITRHVILIYIMKPQIVVLLYFSEWLYMEKFMIFIQNYKTDDLSCVLGPSSAQSAQLHGAPR